MLTKMNKVEDAFAAISDAMQKAAATDKFMVAVWKIDDKGNMVCHRTTWQFPTLRYKEAQDRLGETLEVEEVPTPEPLPMADFLKDFGRQFTSRRSSPIEIDPPVEEATSTLEEEVNDEKTP